MKLRISQIFVEVPEFNCQIEQLEQLDERLQKIFGINYQLMLLLRGVYSSRRPNILPQWTPIFFPTRDPYFSVKKPKTIKKGQYYAYLDLI